MTSISLTAADNAHIHQRTVSQSMIAVANSFENIAQAISKRIASNFKNIVELSHVKDHADQKKFTINAKNMEPVVIEAMEEVQKQRPASAKEMALAIKIAKEYFINTYEGNFNDKDFVDATAWTTRLFASSHLYLTKHFVEKVIPLPETMKNTYCYDYALLTCGDDETANILFADYEAEPHEVLLKRGYEIVDDPKPGDLVLFRNKGTFMHLGIMREKGLIESKWGNRHPHAYLHTLENAPVEYGTEILYFRPPLQIRQASAKALQ